MSDIKSKSKTAVVKYNKAMSAATGGETNNVKEPIDFQYTN